MILDNSMSFTPEDVETVWRKASIANNNDPNKFRKDACGAWIRRDQHGVRDSMYGWEIDHITPVSRGGSNSLSNLRPLHWENNVRKSDGNLSCPIVAKEEKNIRLF
jgi:hypothetical protein